MLLQEALLIKAIQVKKLPGTDKGVFLKCHWSIERCVGEPGFGKIGHLGKYLNNTSWAESPDSVSRNQGQRGWDPTWKFRELEHIGWDGLLSMSINSAQWS